MDGARFDRLAAAWATRRSRRGALALLGSGALAGGLRQIRPEPVAARCRHATNCNKSRFPHCHNTTDCFRVKNVDTGECTCITLGLCVEPCSTGADCLTGLCVFANGCCTEITATGKFCASPCFV